MVKGDLTADGTEEQYQQFLDAYTPAFGERLHVIRGNHDSYYGATYASEPTQRVDLPGVTLALIDTSIQHSATGTVRQDQLDWLDALGAEADRPVLLFGHHHPWNPDGLERPDTYFGIHPDQSEQLVEVVARHPRIVGYFAGHTHRNRVRRFSATGEVPWVEVACVKDFPGSVGRVPRVRRRDPAGAPPHLQPRSSHLVGAHPRHVRGHLCGVRLGHARPTVLHDQSPMTLGVWVPATALVLAGAACAAEDRDIADELRRGPIETISPFDLEVGDCFDDPADFAPESDITEVSELQRVPCSSPHDNEVFALVEVTDADEFPGDDAVREEGIELCLPEFEAFVGRSYRSSTLDFDPYFTPTEQSWAAGDREVVCALYDSALEPIEGSMRDSRR